MALEQFQALLEGQPQESLGATVPVGPDRFPLLESSDLKAEHELTSELLTEYLSGKRAFHERFRMKNLKSGWKMLSSSDEERTRLCLALLERLFAHESGLIPEQDRLSYYQYFSYGGAPDTLADLIEKGIDQSTLLEPLILWLSHNKTLYYYKNLLDQLFKQFDPRDLASRFHPELLIIWSRLCDGESAAYYTDLFDRLNQLLGVGLWQVIIPGELWSDAAIIWMQSLPDNERQKWVAFLNHCRAAKSAKPSARWKKQLDPLLASVGEQAFRDKIAEWFPLVDKGRSGPVLTPMWDSTDDQQRIHDINSNILRGLLWACVPVADADLCREIGRLGISAYRKIRGVGPRAVKVGNAAVYALGEIGNLDAVAQLAILKVRVKFRTAQKGIEKALNNTAEKVGISPDELEEMSVPSYGLTEPGLRVEMLGEHKAELRLDGKKPKLHWFKPDGKEQKSVPSAVKKDFSDDLKELKQAVKDIDKMLPAQSARIEQCYLAQKEWTFPVWCERYHEHPLMATLARRLIWQFQAADQSTAAIWSGDGFVDSGNEPVEGISDSTTVSLWHPLVELETDAITAWRDWLMEHQIRQPFKQAHREVYLLTDAERNTSVYSNRFAAHILKQHQFNALCAARNWRNTLRLMVDDSAPPAHLVLPNWNLRAEFWIEGVGQDYGVDTNETGTYLYLVTDQVRFYRIAAAVNWAHVGGGGYESSGADEPENRPLELEQIPALVFSEVMRDVDLFVGVASVGNDPSWNDGGPEGRYLDYWQDYSFGELGNSAKTRKEVLEKLIPRLKIARRCSFQDRFLVVRGEVRTYKIHLGSGNILMEPNDQYLCIVPSQSVAMKGDGIFLPFEGDKMLSIILSKAMLLADDTKIKDSTILSQINH